MGPLLLAGLKTGISALGNVAGNLINRVAANRAYKRDMAMMRYMNEYNSPKAQMSRLKAAGLHPALALQGGAITGNMSNTPKYQEPQKVFNLDVPDLVDSIGKYTNTKKVEVETDKLKKDLDLMDLVRASMLLDQQLKGKEVDIKELDRKLKEQSLPYEMDVLKERANLSQLDRYLKERLLKKETINADSEDIVKELKNSIIGAQLYKLTNDAGMSAELLRLAKKGIFPNTPYYWKLFESSDFKEKIQEFKTDPKKVIKEFNKYKGGNEFTFPWSEDNFWYNLFKGQK